MFWEDFEKVTLFMLNKKILVSETNGLWTPIFVCDWVCDIKMALFLSDILINLERMLVTKQLLSS